MSLNFPLKSLLRERTGNIGNTQGTYILFPIDPNVADVFPLVPLCSQCTPRSLCSKCIFHYSLSIYVSSVFPIVSGVPCVVSIIPSVPIFESRVANGNALRIEFSF